MRKIITFIISVCLVLCTVGCEIDTETTTIKEEELTEKLSFIADFYSNNGKQWLSVEGNEFDIKPNKIKEYYYDSNGSWTYHYTMSSVMSIDIDNQSIESCGSTIIFADSRLKKYEIDIPETINMTDYSDKSSISTPTDMRIKDFYSLQYWWYDKDLQNNTKGSKAVIIQSQNGDNICMYVGDNVTWDIPDNLPKTTEITIDNKKLFIHRANFSIIDASILESGR